MPNGYSSESETQRAARAAGHEPTAVSVRGVVYTGIGVIAVVALAFVLVWWIMRAFAPSTAETTPDRTVERAETQALPVDAKVSDQLRQLRTLEQARLEQYGWTDPAAGIARIPIERAIEIVAERGVSLGPQSAAASDGPSSQEASGPAAEQAPVNGEAPQ